LAWHAWRERFQAFVVFSARASKNVIELCVWARKANSLHARAEREKFELAEWSSHDLLGSPKKGGAGGGKNSIMNGRALFSYNPDLFVDDEGENDAPTNAKDEEEKQADEEKE